MTILDIAQSMKGRLRDGLSQTQSGTQPGESEVAFGTAAADSSGGFVSIIMDGAPQPGDPDYDPDDPDFYDKYTFTVPCDSPISENSRVSYISDAGRGKAVSLGTLTQIAEDADAIATATDQHFWADSGGVHVSTDEDDPAGAQNIIMNSAGVLLREGSDYLAAFTPSAVAFYDGQGNQSANITATFGKDGAVIGAEGSSRIALESEGLTLSDGGGAAIFDVRRSEFGPISEWTSENGRYSGSDPVSFPLGSAPVSSTSINVRVSSGNKYTTFVTFTAGTAAGPLDLEFNSTKVGEVSYDGAATLTVAMSDWTSDFLIRADYYTSNYYPPAMTFGTRKGQLGEYTATFGKGLIATNDDVHSLTPPIYGVPSLVCGQFNDDTVAPFVVGSGTSDFARRNAFVVDYSGNAELRGGLTLGTPLPIASGGSGQTGTSTDTTISNIITAGTGITITEAHYCTWGKVAMLMVGLKRSTAISAGGAITIGSVNSGHRPVTDAAGGSNTLNGWLSTGGNFTARNISGSQISANTAIYISLTYLLP